MPFNKCMKALNVVWRQGDDSSGSHNWLNPKTCYFPVAARVELLFCVLEHGLMGRVGAAVEVGPSESLQLHTAV